MSLSAFADESHAPTEKDLSGCLGAAFALWTRVRKDVALQVPEITEEWGYTSRATGWGLRLKQGKRVILYLTPGKGQFLASTALGEKAVAEGAGRRLSHSLRRLIGAAPRYAEGRGVRLSVKRASDVRDAAQLVSLKLST